MSRFWFVRHCGCAAMILCAGFLVSSAAGGAPPQKAAAPPQKAAAPQQPERLATAAHLPNAWRIHPRVISGGLPEGDEAFAELAALGVRTIITVDGTKPDVAAAAKFGMRYVHLPHGYDGIPPLRVAELAKAIRDLPGPIYVHCHHGKHRAPAAAAVGCVAAGLLAPANAEGVLKAAGTSPDYRGLYQAAREAAPLDKQSLDALRPEFLAVAEIPPLAEAMVAVDQLHDRLKRLAAAGWKANTAEVAQQPDHQALLLWEQFGELLRHEDSLGRPPRFRELMRQSESAALELQTALKADQAAKSNAALARVSLSCTTCHREFRDTPLGEKKSSAAKE